VLGCVIPRLNWARPKQPGILEKVLAGYVLSRWISHNSPAETNPLAISGDLESAQAEYSEHCAVCHGLDGSGRNRFQADFYPPVVKLTSDEVQNLSDGGIYFIIANGIRNTAMPAFGRNHSREDIRRTVLWVRHLSHMTPTEKAAIEKQMRSATQEHEKTMRHGMGPHEHQ
jgi:mono/diheme cytochrome c family protein